MSTFHERVHAMLSSVDLPAMSVDLATYRRLEAMEQRIVAEDDSYVFGEDFEHVVYAAICEGLRQSERDAGVEYDENTGVAL